MCSSDLKQLLSGGYAYYSGAIAQIVIERYFTLQQACGLIALVLLVLEKFYSNRPIDRFATGLVGALLAMSLVGGFWLEPYMKRLHTTKYAQSSSPAQREFAEVRFRRWHGLSQFANLVVMIGLLVYLRRVSTPPEAPRFLDTSLVRS